MASGEDSPSKGGSAMLDCHFWDGSKTLAAAGFSDIQTNMSNNVPANAQTHFDQHSSSTDPLIDLFQAQSYVNLIESSGLPFYRSQESSVDRRLGIFPLNLWIPKEESVSSETLMKIDQAESLQAINMNNARGLQSNLEGETTPSYIASASVKSTTKRKLKSLKRVSEKLKKRAEAESFRRSIVSQKVQILHDDLPETLKDKRANQVSVLHNVIGHIKYLQLHLKELSKSRLACKSNSVPLKFVEGYGYYHPDADLFHEPVDETVRSLFQEDPYAMPKVLEDCGLCTIPMASFYEFLGSKGCSALDKAFGLMGEGLEFDFKAMHTLLMRHVKKYGGGWTSNC